MHSRACDDPRPHKRRREGPWGGHPLSGSGSGFRYPDRLAASRAFGCTVVGVVANGVISAKGCLSLRQSRRPPRLHELEVAELWERDGLLATLWTRPIS
jgi:hypothetical protein